MSMSEYEEQFRSPTILHQIFAAAPGDGGNDRIVDAVGGAALVGC
jgi:hypothetical protein